MVKRILLRLAMFVAPATAMWALLPIIAKQRLHLAASGYGILFAALGVGAVTGAMVIPKVKGKLSANGMLTVAALSFGVGLALTVLVPSFVVALLALVVCGLGWTATASVLVAELQMFLPQWVRARAVAVYLMTFTAAQAVASPIWGQVTQHFGVTLAICVAAGLVVTGGLAGIWAPMPDAGDLDNSPLSYWMSAPLMVDPEPDAGPVAVQVDYDVPPENQAQFIAAMADMRRSRQRSGAMRWEFYRVGRTPTTSWRSSRSRPGRSTSASTTSGSPRGRTDRERRLPVGEFAAPGATPVAAVDSGSSHGSPASFCDLPGATERDLAPR